MARGEVLGQRACTGLQLGCEAEMQGEGHLLVLQVQARQLGAGGGKLSLDGIQPCVIERQAYRLTIGPAALGAMHAGCRQTQGSRQLVDLRQRTP